jgi:GAF domain-containing protein
MDVRTLAIVANLLSVARRMTGAQAGTVYRREADGLRFLVSQNDELARSAGHAAGIDVFTRSALRWTEPGIASYVTLTQAPLNIPDAYDIPTSRPYSFNRRFDTVTGFRTISMLVVPLQSPIVGALQLLNATNDRGDVIPFSEDVEHAIADLAVRMPSAV